MIEAQAEVLLNYVGGKWMPSQAGAKGPVRNPATAETIALVPMSPAEEADAAVKAAVKDYHVWGETPVVGRSKPLFELRDLLLASRDGRARTITNEAGKTYGESKVGMQRAIENVEGAGGAPILLQGYNNEDIAS